MQQLVIAAAAKGKGYVWVRREDGELGVVKVKHLGEQELKVGSKVNVEFERVRAATSSTTVSGVDCASYHGFRDMSVVITGSHTFEIPDGVDNAAITVGMGHVVNGGPNNTEWGIQVCVHPKPQQEIFRFLLSSVRIKLSIG